MTIPHIIFEFSLVLDDDLLLRRLRLRLLCSRTTDSVLAGLVRLHLNWLPVLTLTVPFAHLHLSFVAVSIGKDEFCLLGRERIIDKGATVGASIIKHHLAEALEAVLKELSNVKHATLHGIEPVGASTMHPIIHKEAVVDVTLLRHCGAPAGAFAICELTNVLGPELFILGNAPLLFGFRLFHCHLDRREDVIEVSMLRQLPLNLGTTFAGFCLALFGLVHPLFHSLEKVISCASKGVVHENASVIGCFELFENAEAILL